MPQTARREELLFTHSSINRPLNLFVCGVCTYNLRTGSRIRGFYMYVVAHVVHVPSIYNRLLIAIVNEIYMVDG